MGLLDDAIAQQERRLEDEVTAVARESVSTEKEKEYCLWVKPTDEGWKWLMDQSGSMRMDVLIPIINGRCRARIEQTEEGAFKGELSNKYRAEEGSNEINSDIGVMQVLGFHSNTDYLTHMFRRISLEASEAVRAQAGTSWDIDVFFTTQGRPGPFGSISEFQECVDIISQGSRVGEWVKVELNVEKFLLPGIEAHIPFAFSEAIPSRTQDPQLQEIVRHYWDVVTAF
jgi:hypothetical protein